MQLPPESIGILVLQTLPFKMLPLGTQLPYYEKHKSEGEGMCIKCSSQQPQLS